MRFRVDVWPAEARPGMSYVGIFTSGGTNLGTLIMFEREAAEFKKRLEKGARRVRVQSELSMRRVRL